MHGSQVMAGDKPTLEAMLLGCSRGFLVDGAKNPDPMTQVRAW